MRFLYLLLTFLTFQIMQGQEEAPPFAEIGPYQEHYSAQGVMHRLIQVLVIDIIGLLQSCAQRI